MFRGIDKNNEIAITKYGYVEEFAKIYLDIWDKYIKYFSI